MAVTISVLIMKTIKSCGQKEVSTIYFDWHLTDWCNYKCSYCPVLVTNDFTKDNHAPYKIVLARLGMVETTFDICITGGEPTLHPNILEILDGIAKCKSSQDIALFTNLSRPAPYYEKIRDLKSKKIVVFASYHPEFAKDNFLERCLAVSQIDDLRFSVHVSLHDDPQYWDQTIEVLDTLKSNNVQVKPLLLSANHHYEPKYTSEFYKIFKPYLDNTVEIQFFKDVECEYTDGTRESFKSYDFEIKGLNRFKGYECTPVSYSIDISGTIQNTCTRRRVPLSLVNKNLIVKETCPQDICPGRRLLKFYKEKI